MNYFLVGLLVLATAAALLLSGRRVRAQPLVPPTIPASVPAGPLVVSTLAGHPLPDSYGDGSRLEAWFSRVGVLGLDALGNLYVAGGSEIRQVTPTGQVRTLAGAPPAQNVLLRDSYTTYGDYNPSVDGHGRTARLRPGALAVAPDGTVFLPKTTPCAASVRRARSRLGLARSAPTTTRCGIATGRWPRPAFTKFGGWRWTRPATST